MLSIIIDEVIGANFLESVDFGCLHIGIDYLHEIFEGTTEGVLVASGLPIALEAFLIGRLIVGLAILQFDAQAEVNFWVLVDDACLASFMEGRARMRSGTPGTTPDAALMAIFFPLVAPSASFLGWKRRVEKAGYCRRNHRTQAICN